METLAKRDYDMKIAEIITESRRIKIIEGARIMHAEDLVFFEGSTGAMRALNNIAALAKGKNRDTLSIKWDGKPALIFGRNEQGEFIMTDKAGFGAKGYNGLYKSAKEFVAQKSAKGLDPAYLNKITQIWPMVEAAVPANYRGFVHGDVMWFPGEIQDNGLKFVFTPNTVTYEVDKKSQIGRIVGQSRAGIAVHTYYSAVGAESVPLKNTAGLNINGPLCVLGPEIKNEAPLQHDKPKVDQLTKYIKSTAKAVDIFLDETILRAEKMSGLPDLLYNYVNSQTKGNDLSHLYERFGSWVQSNQKLSKPMVAKVSEYCQANSAGLQAIFNIFDAITFLKLDVIRQLDSHEGPVTAHVAGQRGHEGYVNADPGGHIKFVNRLGFTAANAAQNNN
jgi:hypothetical protein